MVLEQLWEKAVVGEFRIFHVVNHVVNFVEPCILVFMGDCRIFGVGIFYG